MMPLLGAAAIVGLVFLAGFVIGRRRGSRETTALIALQMRQAADRLGLHREVKRVIDDAVDHLSR